MLFVPIDKFTLLSAKTPVELVAVLNASVAKKRTNYIRSPEEPFYGNFDQYEFNLEKTWGAQAGIVSIKGNFKTVESATHITVIQRPKIAFVGFVFIWMIAMLAFAGAGLSASSLEQYDHMASLLSVAIAVFMMGAGAVIFLKMFWDQAGGTRYLLKLILEAEEIS